MRKASFVLSCIMLLFVQWSYGQYVSQTKENNDKRTQIPVFMQKSYFEATFGAINYPFSAEQLEPGYRFESVKVSHSAVRLVLMGHQFNKYLAAQITYMRPIYWVGYDYTDESEGTGRVHGHSVWMNIAGLTIKPQLPIGQRFSLYAEGGLGLVTRHGFKDDYGNPVIKDANFATVTFGAGLHYKINNRFGLQLATSYTPANEKDKQPYTTFMGGGVRYNFRPFSEERIEKAAKRGQIHPRQWIQLGISSNVLGYGINNFVADIPIFWGGNSEVAQGIQLTYQKNIFHGPRFFAMDWGTNISYWQTRDNRENFFTISIFPVFRFNYLHTKPFDAYFFYTLGGPAFISKSTLDGDDTGKKFTFYDAMALGFFFGKTRQYNLEFKIAHFSNGNIFPQNGGVKIPLSLNIGYAF